MTMGIKQHENNKYCITMEWKKTNNGGLYIVEACEKIDDLRIYPFKKMIYSVDEKKKAEATFRRYVKKYC